MRFTIGTREFKNEIQREYCSLRNSPTDYVWRVAMLSFILGAMIGAFGMAFSAHPHPPLGWR